MAELVIKSAEAVTISDSLTVLLDWINIERFGGDFTLVVENVGGGDAGPLQQVQIDTSPDGGVTVNTNQHPEVSMTIIAAGTAEVGKFEDDSNYIRVRTQTLVPSTTTTAKGILVAETTIGRLCTLADVKNRLGISTVEHDTAINGIIAGIEELFNSHVHRELIAPAVAVTEYYTIEGLNRLLVRRYPIISVTSIKESYDYDFDSAEVLVADTDYRLIRGGENGVVLRLCGNWSIAEDSIQLIYRGGYCSAGQVPGAGEFALPADIREVATMQASFIFKRRDDIGLSSVSSEGGSISKYSSMELLPIVKQTLDRYRRPLP